jgi:hypothetical protein
MPKHVNFKLNDSLAEIMAAWLAKHPDIDRTTLCNLALREFLSKPHTLEPVVMQASAEEVDRAVNMMIHDYADTLDRLK